jgi:hypothetical protein
MTRYQIIKTVGDKFHIPNIENGEFSYAQALDNVGKKIKDYQKDDNSKNHQYLDLRFENDRLVILVECKDYFSKYETESIHKQLQDYVRYEKVLSDKKIVAILAETKGDEIWVWYGQSVIIDEKHRKKEETILKTFAEYEDLLFGKVNDKIKIVDSTKELNEKLHSYGINEKLRSQFVGTCLLSLKNGLVYEKIKETLNPNTGEKMSPEKVVLNNIKSILSGLLSKNGNINSLNKAGKLSILSNKVLDDQDITSLTYYELVDTLYK